MHPNSTTMRRAVKVCVGCRTMVVAIVLVACSEKRTPSTQPPAGGPAPAVDTDEGVAAWNVQIDDTTRVSPASDSIPSGRYALSIDVQFASGQNHADRKVCRVSVDGNVVQLAVERHQGPPIIGSIEAGRFSAQFVEGEVQWTLSGTTTSNARIEGRVSGGTDDAAITDGRWSLERIPGRSSPRETNSE